MTNTTTTITTTNTTPIVAGFKAGAEAALREAAFLAVPGAIGVGICAAIGGKKAAIEAAKNAGMLIGLFSTVEFVWEAKDGYDTAKRRIATMPETDYEFENEEDE